VIQRSIRERRIGLRVGPPYQWLAWKKKDWDEKIKGNLCHPVGYGTDLMRSSSGNTLNRTKRRDARERLRKGETSRTGQHAERPTALKGGREKPSFYDKLKREKVGTKNGSFRCARRGLKPGSNTPRARKIYKCTPNKERERVALVLVNTAKQRVQVRKKEN